MTNDQDPTRKQIIDMTMSEKSAAMAADPVGYMERAYEEERPRAQLQVDRQIERLRRLGHDGLVGSA